MLLAPKLPRSLRQLTIIATVFLTILLLLRIHWRQSSKRTIQYDAFKGHITSRSDATELCSAHGFPPFTPQPSNPRRRRVYDTFLLSTELDWLTVRLNTLYQSVDYFIIVESDRTFTGLPKPLHLRDRWPDFATFHRKLIYVVVADTVNSTRAWDHEDAFRDGLLYAAAEQIRGTERDFRDGDALIVSDIDEISRPETIKVLRYCDFPDRLTLRSQFYYYSFQWLHRGEQWAHPQATVYRGLERTISPTDLRNGEGGPGAPSIFGPLRRWWQKADLFDAAWHCSSCFRTVKEMQTKMQSFSHTPWNTEENREPRTIIERVRQGLDLFNREGEVYDKIDGNPDVPPFVLEKWQNYRYLLNRDGADASFEDVKELGLG